jgi:putative oxidoreductase
MKTEQLAPIVSKPDAAARTGLAIRIIPWAAQLVVAAILAQTLYFKFTYSLETELIFGPRGGRPAATLVGFVELIAAVLLLVPRTAAAGAALSLMVIGGAIFTHLTSLGIEVAGDGGLLFALALSVALGALVVLAFRWRELPGIARLLAR